MAILAGKWAALRRSALPALLAASLFLMACGATGGANSADPAPAFTSAPGTAATQDSAYAYQITTSPASATLALTGAPAGATLSGNTVTWTPSAAQSRVANQFVVTATSSAGSTTQSWSVMPTGTVSGTWVDTYWAATGPQSHPFDWTKGPTLPAALVPQSDGTLQTLQGSGNSDGTFSIPNVPGGYYWIEPVAAVSTSPPGLGSFLPGQPVSSIVLSGSPVTYWTSASAIDLGADLNGQPLATTTTATTTTISVNFTGLDPLQSGDELVFDGPVTIASTNPQPTGATTFSAGEIVNSNIDFSQPRTAFMLQYEPEPLGGLNVLALGPAVTLPNLALSNGTSNTVNGALGPSPQASFDLNVQGSAWPALFINVAPTQPTMEGADLEVSALPFMSGNALPPANFTERAALLFDVQSVSQPPSGFSEVLPGEAPITGDQDFGLATYDDAFPSAWPRVFSFSQTATVPVPIPNSSTPYTFQLVAAQSSALPTSRIAPLIGPVQNPKINGTSLFTSGTVSATGITLSWTAPSGATPTGYKISAYAATQVPVIGTWTYGPGPTFYTTKTSVALPQPLPSNTYVFEITSVLDGAANFETSPNRSALPTASASVVSAPITTQ